MKPSDYVKEVARGALYSVVLTELMETFPSIKKAIDRIPSAKWIEFVDEREQAMIDLLSNRFGTSS